VTPLLVHARPMLAFSTTWLEACFRHRPTPFAVATCWRAHGERPMIRTSSWCARGSRRSGEQGLLFAKARRDRSAGAAGLGRWICSAATAPVVRARRCGRIG